MITSSQKKWRLVRARLGRHPLWAAWQLTYRCNFRCRFCDYWRDPMGKLPEQTLEQFDIGSAKLAHWGSLLISLAGGEPLLRKDIVEIVRLIARWHFPFITTNGYLITEELAADLFAAGCWGISVSIDYAQADRHDRARGINGAYDRAVKALAICSRARQHPWQRVNLMAVLLHDNLDQVESLLQLAAEHDAFFMIQPYSPMKTGDQQFRAPAHLGAAQHLLALKAKYPNFLSNATFLSRFDAALDGGIAHCAAGGAFFNIDSTGAIAICVEQRATPVANLYRHNMSTITQRLRQAARLNQCQQCWYNCRGEVESLYRPGSLIQSLPTMLFDHGRPPKKA